MAKNNNQKDLSTPSGIPLPSYPEIPLETTSKTERPGTFPYTRGIHENMYRGRLWTMRQYSGFGTARETNQRFHYLLEEGQTGLSVAFDLPTQIGYDSTDSQAAGEVGKVGVPISTIEDMEELLREIPLESVSISMTINSSAPVLLAFLIVLARRRNMDISNLRGTLQNDILKEFDARHTQRFPLTTSLRLVIDVLEYSTDKLPLWHPISVSGYHIRESGSTAVEELAITMAHAITYFEGAKKRGISLETLAKRFSFFFNAQMNLFEEVAKFRAARRMWANIVKTRFGIKNPEAAKLRFHTQTAGAALTYQQPENNIARVTIQALAAILGGTQSLHTNSCDEALGLPTEKNVRTALRTQQILAYETGVADVADPLGGSPLIESLTDSMEQKAQELIDEIDARGGALKAIEEGVIQSWIESSSYRFQQQVENNELTIVGVNKFVSDSENDTSGEQHEIFQVHPQLEVERFNELTKRKAARSMRPIKSALQLLKKTASGSENLMDPIISCVEVGASIGEVMGSLADVFGEYQGDF